MIDLPYIVIFISLFIFTVFFKNRKYSFFISSLIIFIFYAFRAPVVGADTYNYVRFFSGKQKFYSLLDSREFERGFTIYNDLLRSISDNEVFYLVINYVFILSPIFYLVRKYSKNPTLSLFLFFAFLVYQPYFVALRQILSISFSLWGIIFIIEKRKFSFVFFGVFSIFAYLFHTTSLFITFVLIVTYFVKLQNKKIIYTLILISTILGPFLGQNVYLDLFSLFSRFNIGYLDRIGGYLQFKDSYQGLSIISTTIKSVIGLVVFRNLNSKYINHWFSKIFLISILINNIFYSFPFLSRINLGLWLFSIVVYTWILKGNGFATKGKTSSYISFCIILYFSFVFIRENINPNLKDSGRMHPYYFFFEDYTDHPSRKYF